MRPSAKTPADAPLFPRLGAGVGLRPKHHAAALAPGAPLPDFFELITENVFGAGGRPREVLDEARRLRPIALHGVSLSIGSLDPLDTRYLDRVAALVERVGPAVVSDHLCFTSHGGRHAHDLLPLCFTEPEAERIAARVREVQARLGRRILLENVSSYLAWKGSTMSEWSFLAAVVEAADAGILLDVNNVFVSAKNHGFDAHEYLDALPARRIGQIHLAGHADRGRYLFDTHDAPVIEPVWALYEHALARFGPVSTLIERDDKLPPWDELLAEAARARALLETYGDAEPEARALPSPRAATGPGAASNELLWNALVLGDATPALAQIEGGAMTPAERLSVYAESYRARLHDALAEDFRATDALLGHARFHDAALEYAHRHPSTSPDLADFGRAFPAFLASIGVPAAAGIAALEWARVESFQDADAAPLGAATLAAVAPDRWPSLRFVPHPSLRFVEARFRVDAIWRAADTGAPVPSPVSAEGALRVWREGTTVYHAWMEPPEHAALSALAAGEPFSTAADRLAAALRADADGSAQRLAAFLRDWIADGLFASVR